MRSTQRLPSPIANATLSRNVVLVACAASAGVHAGLVPSHLVENLWLGIAFAASVGLLLALIVSLWRAGVPRRPAASAAAVLAALIVAYSLSRTVGLAPLEEDVEPVDAIGLLTQGVQAAGLIAALHLCHRMGGVSPRGQKGTLMNTVEALRRRRVSVPAIVLIALTSAALAVTTSGAQETHAAGAHHEALVGTHGHAAPTHALTARQLAFHDAMRKLWEDHITWTRLAIVSFAGGLPDLPATEARLLANQVDIGNAIKPYYGRTAGNRLTALLKDHILGAVALLQAAKSGDQTAIGEASAAWYANGNQIADFLHAANPHAWAKTTMRAMMKTHLDQTLAEAQHRLQGNYAADVRDYDVVHRHILDMADTLSHGIVRQFPKRFR